MKRYFLLLSYTLMATFSIVDTALPCDQTIFFRGVSKEVRESLSSRWYDLLRRYGLKESQFTHFSIISNAYSNPIRHYHNLNHLYAMFELLDLYKSKHTYQLDYEKIEFAIWFHDIIYEPRFKNNEELSKLMFKEFAHKNSLPKELLDSVSEMIMLTAGHQGANSLEEQIFLDLDLSILGSERGKYLLYLDNIKEEYKEVPRALFFIGRLAFTYKMRKREQLFFTKFFHQMFEARARKNLTYINRKTQ